jgi:hypothetical protein
MTLRIDGPAARITTEAMAGRATALPPDRAFRSALGDGAAVLLGGVEAAARSLPAGEALAAAVHGTAGALSSAGMSGAGAPGAIASRDAGAAADPLAALGLGAGRDQLELIELQQRLQEENRRYSTLSNVLKARHDTAKTAIGNLR